MYICDSCGALFEQPVVWLEPRGVFWGDPAHEGVAGCPDCHGSYSEAIPCTGCGQYTGDTALQDGFCPACITRLQDELFSVLQINFTAPELTALADLFEGEDVLWALTQQGG